jgi:predicted RNase H-like HicB family nuclease
MEIRVRLERDEDGMWIASCSSVPGCISQGKTQMAALKNIRNAIKLHIKCLVEDGLPVFQDKGVREEFIEVDL